MTHAQIYRGSMRGGLLQVKQLGFQPGTVIDVGAALGTFELYDVFPECKHFLIEPIAENEPHLAKLCQKLGNAEYIIAAATRQPGTITLQVNPELVHSSTLDQQPEEMGDSSQPYRTVQAISLDQICQEKQLPPPYLIKVDVDGREVDVLSGATQTLLNTEYVVIESALFIQFHDVIDFMRSQGFVVYDILDIAWRPGDGALWQTDLAFVKEASPFRENKSYIDPSQHSAFAANLQSYRESCIAIIENYGNPVQPTLNEQFLLRETNFIAFPDWSQPENQLLQEFTDLFRAVLTHRDRHQITLLIYIGEIDEEEANMLVSSVLLHLVSEEAVDIDSSPPEISLIRQLDPSVWQALLPEIATRLTLPHEDAATIAAVGADRLPAQLLHATHSTP